MPGQLLAQTWLALKDAISITIHSFFPPHFQRHKPQACSHFWAYLCHLYFPSSTQQEFWKKWSLLKWLTQLPKRNLLLCLRRYSSVKYRNARLTFCLLHKHP